MAVPLYFDVHVPLAIANQLRLRGADVLRAQEDHAARTPDEIILIRATALQRAVVTFDHRFRAHAEDCVRDGIPFAGLIFADINSASVGKLVSDLQLIALAGEAVDCRNRIIWLPWR